MITVSVQTPPAWRRFFTSPRSRFDAGAARDTRQRRTSGTGTGRALSRWAVSALAWAFCQAGPAFAVETLDMLVATQSGFTSSPGTDFDDALPCLTNPVATARDLLVSASFSSYTTGQGSDLARFRLTAGADASVAHARFLNGGNDLGVGNVAWVFPAVSGGDICLQHADGGSGFRTQWITLTVIPLDTATASLDWGHDSLAATSTTSPSTSFVPVGEPVTVQVDNISTRGVFIAATLSSSAPLDTSENGEWKLQVRNATDGGSWTDVGTPITRTFNASATSNDNGIVQLYAIADGLLGGKDYEVRLLMRSVGGSQINTDTASLAALSLGFDDNGGGFFPWFQDTTASASDNSNSLDPISGLDAGFTLTTTADVFVAMSLDATHTTGGNADGSFETCIEDPGPPVSYVFGTDTNGDAQEVSRAFQSNTDFGAMGVVGVWEPDPGTTGTFTAHGCWSITGGTIDTTDPNLVGFVGASLDPTVPVTLSYFRATGGGRFIEFEWSTATETGNAGFNLYVRGLDGGWERINEEPIPSKVVDSVERQRYGYEAVGVEGDEFAIEDVDIFGVTRLRGPFELGRKYGRAGERGGKIAWKSIRSKHKEKRRARKHGKRAKMERKLERRRRQLETSAVTASWLNRGMSREASALGPVTDTGLLNLEVIESGLHRVTHEELLAAGVDLSGIRTKRIGLTAGGEDVPVWVRGALKPENKKKKKRKQRQASRPERFGPGGYIEFVGQPLDTLYTKTNVYVLRLSKSAVQTGAEDGVAPGGAAVAPFYLETERVEKDSEYSTGAPNGDPWYAEWLMAFSPLEKDFSLTVDEYDGEAPAPVTLSVGLWGVTDLPADPDHHVVVSLNGKEVAEEWFDGRLDLPMELELSDGALVEGGNTLTLALPLDTTAAFDLVALDSYAVTYPRRFVARDGRLSFMAAAEAFEVDGLPSADVVVHRVGADGTVAYLTGVETTATGGAYRARFAGSGEEATYHVSTAGALYAPVLAPSQPETDITVGESSYLIIAHPDFIGPALDQLVGMRQAQGYTVKVVDVEDIYAQFGHAVPGAQPIKDYIAYAHANLGIEMVLLVGGDTYDYFDHLGLGAVSFVPTLYAKTDKFVWYAPVDALYADVDGDQVPDLAIGRLPVRTEAELETWVNRSTAWDQRDYGNTAVFAADEHDANQGYSFSADSDNLIDAMPADWNVSRAYMDDGDLPAVREALISAINNGAAVTSFFGHSSYSLWSFQHLLTANDVKALENFSRPTVVTQWGCWNTYYVSPSENTMGHNFLLNGDRGAVAVLGASTLTEAQAEREMSTVLFGYLLSPGVTIGDAVLQAKRDYAKSRPKQLDVILGWSLLGDPALTIGQP